ncbi:hypothetical protein [Nocardia aurea]|uniref:hypothetical protein n=1 Tax=Nocardia aurea TaxID=2144174 RepID=UPI0033BA735D
MTRGKYAAKASNRLANLDNELLQRTIAERDALKAERDHLARQVHDLTRDSEALAMRRAGELAGVELTRLREEIAEENRQRPLRDEEQFRALCRIFKKYEKVPGKDLPEIAEIFGCGKIAGAIFEEEIFDGIEGRGSRFQRRHSAKTYRIIEEIRASEGERQARLVKQMKARLAEKAGDVEGAVANGSEHINESERGEGA